MAEKLGPPQSYGFASNLRGALPNASFIGFTGTPSPYKALVAFTDVVMDAKDGQEYTEAKMNGFPEAATGDIEKRMNDEG